MVYTMGFKPFTDESGENQAILPRTKFSFLKVAARIDGKLLVPDTFDYSPVLRIEDPDGNDVTSAWVTKALDPNDPDDVYDENHSTYKGDVAGADANIGLFADDSGHVAVKVKVPDGAEETDDDSNRNYKAIWDIRKNGQTLQDSDGETFELFNVGPPGVIAFSSTIISVEDIKDGFSTSLSDDQIERLIERATNKKVRGRLLACNVDPDTHEDFETSIPPQVQEAIILYTQSLIATRDTSANQFVAARRQGSKEVRYSVSGDKLSRTLKGEADEELATYCMSKNRPKFRSTRRSRKDGAWNPNTRRVVP